MDSGLKRHEGKVFKRQWNHLNDDESESFTVNINLIVVISPTGAGPKRCQKRDS